MSEFLKLHQHAPVGLIYSFGGESSEGSYAGAGVVRLVPAGAVDEIRAAL